MSRAQQFITTILDNFPVHSLPSDEDRSKFEQIKQKLSTAADVQDELKRLYQVRGFSDAALSLLWVAERLENDPARLEVAADEEDLVVRHFTAAFGGGESEAFSPAPAGQEVPSVTELSETSVEEAGTTTHETDASAGGPAGGSEAEFASLIEKFVEAMQAGEDSREALMEQVVAQSKSLSSGAVQETLQQYCHHLIEFLTYVRENQFMDDVRVMNILSNISSPISQWASASPDERSGILDEAVATLMDFKALFE